jgi:hypothetical protein
MTPWWVNQTVRISGFLGPKYLDGLTDKELSDFSKATATLVGEVAVELSRRRRRNRA